MYIPVTFRVNRVELDDAEKRLEGLAARAEDLQVPLTHIGVRLKKDFAEQFSTQGGYAYDWPELGAGPWKLLTDAYRVWKEKHYPGRPILVATGMMKDKSVLGGGMTVTRRNLFYTPANAIQTRTYEYRRATKTEYDEAPPEDRKFAWGYLVRGPHTRAYDMAKVAYFHQVGAGNNPRRPMVAYPLSELGEWRDILREWLDGRFR